MAEATKKKLEYKSLDKNPYLESHQKMGQLGSGGFGNVFLYANDLGLLAIKSFRPGPDSQEEFEYEYECYHNLGKNEHIAEFIEGFVVKGEFFIVMEYFECGDLSKIYDDFPSYTEADVRDIVVQVSSGLSYMNGKKYVHRDIKPANIFVRSWEPIAVAVGDFNFSKRADGNRMTVFLTNLGTSLYKAPEVEKKEKYNEKCDVWSIGVMLYQLLSGRQDPFDVNALDLESMKKELSKLSDSGFSQMVSEKMAQLKNKPVFEVPNTVHWTQVSPEGKTMISRMLTYDPKVRIGFKDIINSPWAKLKFKKFPELYNPDEFEEGERALLSRVSKLLKKKKP